MVLAVCAADHELPVAADSSPAHQPRSTQVQTHCVPLAIVLSRALHCAQAV